MKNNCEICKKLTTLNKDNLCKSCQHRINQELDNPMHIVGMGILLLAEFICSHDISIKRKNVR